MAVTWASFYPYVQPHVSGCPEIVIESHLQEAAADFCVVSQIWRYDIDKDYTSKNTSDYEVEVPTDAVLEDVLVLYVDGVAIQRVADHNYALPSSAPNSRPFKYSIYQDDQVRFYPTPDRKYEFEGTAVLKPALTAKGVEDWIFETHGRSISCGAIARLTAIPGKEWTNPELAAYYKAEFNKHAIAAKGRDSRRANLGVKQVGFDGVARRRGI